MTKLLFAALAALFLTVETAAAQTGSPGAGNPAGTTPGTQAAPGVPAPHSLNQTDRLFIHQATLGGRAEVEMGKMAAQQGQSDSVKKFGQQMVQDHGKANDQLTRLAKAANVAQPDELDQARKDAQAQLGSLSGASFDAAYIQAQIGDHQQTVQLLEHEIGSGQDEALKRFATEQLPVVVHHLEMARSIQSELSHGRGSTGASGAPASGERTGQSQSDRDATERKETERLNQEQLQKQ